MYWRIGAAYRRIPNEKNKAAFRRVVQHGPPPGLLAFDGELPVGWCQLTRRDVLPHLDRSFVATGDEGEPVWAISCLYVRKGHRRKGVTGALIEAAIDTAQRAKAPAVEAYPFDSAVSPSSTGTGYASTFARAGFRVIAHRSRARPVMRRELRARV
jgi:GNAT superfamily N-acetyltransferase